MILARTTFWNVDQLQNFPNQTGGATTPAGTGAFATNTLGYTYWADAVLCDATYRVSFTFAHSAATLNLQFHAGGLQDISDERWGIDNITVSISPDTTVVTPGPLPSITVTSDPAILETNGVQQFTAVGRDAAGNTFAVAPVWSDVAGGGTISATGLFTAGTLPGTFTNTVQATTGSISGFATVTVTSPLSSASAFGILAGAGISCATSGSVTGATGTADIGSSPTLTITGFPAPCTLTGSIPLAADVATAKDALTAAYLAAQGQACTLDLTGTDLGFYDGSIPASTLAPGTYCFSTAAALTGTLKLTGAATDKWTFQIGSTLNAEVGAIVTMAGGAIPDNVYWAVGTSATLKTGAAFKGNILALTDITLQNGVTLLGRALARNGAVAMIAGGASIIRP